VAANAYVGGMVAMELLRRVVVADRDQPQWRVCSLKQRGNKGTTTWNTLLRARVTVLQYNQLC
jgi:hypothetical protein